MGAVLSQFGWAARIGMAVLVLIVLAALAAPWIAPHDPMAMNPLQRLKPPSAEHLLGTDNFGRDLYSRVIWGARISLLIGIGAAVISGLRGAGLHTLDEHIQTDSLVERGRLAAGLFMGIGRDV